MGAEMLRVEPDFIHDCREGLELIYQRDYESAMVFWEDMGRKWRGSGVSPVGRVLVWQALMLENLISVTSSSTRRPGGKLEKTWKSP